MMIPRGKRVKIVAPPDYPNVDPEYGTVEETPKGVFAQMAGFYKIRSEYDNLVYEVHRSQIRDVNTHHGLSTGLHGME